MEPAPIVNLTDVPHLFEASDRLPHNRKFLWAILDVLDGDGRCIASVNYAYVILDGHPYPTIVKHGLVLLNKSVDYGLEGIVEMGQIKLRAEAVAVKRFIKGKIERWINLIDRRSGVP